MIKLNVEFDQKEMKKLRKQLDDEMKTTIWDIADQIFAISQENVPVDKATLKKSGNVRYGIGYALIGYNTPYAEDIHDGHKSHNRHVDEYMRVPPGSYKYTSKGKIKGAKQRKAIKDQMLFGALIRVKSHTRHMNESMGRPYLDDAIKEVLRRLPPDVRDSIVITRMEREL